jgi:ankyrin repeat protein
MSYPQSYSIYRYVKLYKLHEAAKSGLIDKVDKYLRMGYVVNAVDPRFGMTPLHLTIRNGYVEVAKLLIRNGAGLDDPSLQGITPRQWANEYISTEELEELQRLSMELRKNQAAKTDITH